MNRLSEATFRSAKDVLTELGKLRLEGHHPGPGLIIARPGIDKERRKAGRQE